MTNQDLANFIWQIADLLRGPYRPPQYERVMLPLVVLRRFDCVLADTKPAVIKKYKKMIESGQAPHDAILNKVAGGTENPDLSFHNHSELDFENSKATPMQSPVTCSNTSTAFPKTFARSLSGLNSPKR